MFEGPIQDLIDELELAGKKVLTVKLIAVFVGIVGLGILAVGYLFNILLAR